MCPFVTCTMKREKFRFGFLIQLISESYITGWIAGRECLWWTRYQWRLPKDMPWAAGPGGKRPTWRKRSISVLDGQGTNEGCQRISLKSHWNEFISLALIRVLPWAAGPGLTKVNPSHATQADGSFLMLHHLLVLLTSWLVPSHNITTRYWLDDPSPSLGTQCQSLGFCPKVNPMIRHLVIQLHAPDK